MAKPPEPSLPVVRVAEISCQDRPQSWLVEPLWGASSVGLIGGAPKCSKTWLGLDLALSVATGTACLGRYRVPEPGPVLVYLAEDALPIVRQRVEGMARHRGLELPQVEIHVITAPTLRLDQRRHREQLFQTAQRLRPRLLLLDPLVRLHGIDENNASEVAELLAYIRTLQRQLDLSVILVHHTRKNGAAGIAAGQALRGSSDLHAFGDSNLYLQRTKERLLLSSEHRAAPAAPSVYLELVATNAQTAHLEVVAAPSSQKPASLAEQVLALLTDGVVLTRAKLRELLGVKNERFGPDAAGVGTRRPTPPHASRLATSGLTPQGLTLSGPFPFPPKEKQGTERSSASCSHLIHPHSPRGATHARNRLRPPAPRYHDGRRSAPGRLPACSGNRSPMVRRLSLTWFQLQPAPPLLRERGQPSLLLPQVSQPRQPVGTVGRLHPATIPPRDDRALPRVGTRHPLDSTRVNSSQSSANTTPEQPPEQRIEEATGTLPHATRAAIHRLPRLIAHQLARLRSFPPIPDNSPSGRHT